MATVTGRLDVVVGPKIETFRWNGRVEDRDAARAAFENAIGKGALAVVYTSPKKAKQVRTFDEVLAEEKKTGSVTAQVSSPLAGG